MCGIYGYIGNVKVKHRKRMVELVMALGTLTEVRGIDATGFYAKSNAFEYMEKHSVQASVFYLESDSFQEAILDGAFVFIGHNRHASIGNICNDNAHPFMTDNIALVHNGSCSHALNLLTAEEKASMEGSTDSEAITIYLERVGIRSKNYANLSNFSIVAFDRIKNVLYFARDEYRPMVIADLRKTYGVRVFASTVEILRAALIKCKMAVPDNIFATRVNHLYEVKASDGEVSRLFDFGISTSRSPKRVEPKRVSHTTPVEYKTPTYLDYLRNRDAYHFSTKADGIKTLVARGMAVYGD